MSANVSARVSRGCLPCRTRRVKCDQARPSCTRCVKRNEVCEGYRDDLTLLFRSENEKAARRVLTRRSSFGSSPRSTASVSSKTSATPLPHKSQKTKDVPELSPEDIAGLNISTPFPWAKSVPQSLIPSAEDQAVSQFFEKFVMYPCNNSSSPGFLEHLPSLFKDVQVEGRLALRWAVRAAAYGSLSAESDSPLISNKAVECYGLALSALAEALADPKQKPDDYVLMTIVVLDMFESIYLKDQPSLGSHTGGMAGILRLRGPDQIYGSRGWSMFRLSHHRLQKQQLAFGQPPLPESEGWLNSLSDELPDIRIEKSNHQISKVCEKARNLFKEINNTENSVDKILEMMGEMHEVDQISLSWRAGPEWSYKTIHRSEVSEDASLPGLIQLHPDVWIAYEWNYYRTGRIILHKHLLGCLDRLETLCSASGSDVLENISSYKDISLSVVRSLIDEVLATVPQSLGDIDHEGRLLGNTRGAAVCKGVGGYFLLWPIRTIKALPLATKEQTLYAKSTFERIRDCTGMKAALGDGSIVED